MLSSDNLIVHKKLRATVNMTREGQLWPGLSYLERVSYFTLELTRLGIGYGKGARYDMQAKDEEPATRSRFVKQDDAPPVLECAGFVELVLYGLRQIEGDIFNYRGLRQVSWHSEFYRRAVLGDHNYKPNWIPGANRPPTMTELNEMGTWAQTPILLFFRHEFEPLEREQSLQAGDVVSFMSQDHAGYHFHSGVWVRTAHEDGLVHSSPASKWDGKDGPKYTPVEAPYYEHFLFPMKENFSRRFGASITRLVGV